MKFLPLIWAGLWRKPARTILTVLSITIAFVLFGILASFDAGYARFVGSLHLDRLSVNPRFAGEFPASDIDQIQKLSGVVSVAPDAGLFGAYQDPKNGVFVLEGDARLFQMFPELKVTAQQRAALAALRTGVIITQRLADRLHFKADDKVPLQSRVAQKNGSMDWTFDVVAIIEGVPGDALGYMIGNYAYFDEARAEKNGTFAHFTVRVADPQKASEMSQIIDRMFANSTTPTRTISERDNQDAAAREGLDIAFFVPAVIGATLFMLLFLTGNVMRQSVEERIPEFAMLQAIGYSGKRILALIFSESLVQCAVGAVIGLVLAKLAFAMTAAFLMKTVSPNVIPIASAVSDQVSWPVMLLGLAVAIAVAGLSGLIPALRARNSSVVDALAGR